MEKFEFKGRVLNVPEMILDDEFNWEELQELACSNTDEQDCKSGCKDCLYAISNLQAFILYEQTK